MMKGRSLLNKEGAADILIRLLYVARIFIRAKMINLIQLFKLNIKSHY